MFYRFNKMGLRALTLIFAVLILSIGFCTLLTYAEGRKPLSTVGVTARASTLGWGLEASTPLIGNLNGRVGFNTFSVGYEATAEDIEYDFDLTLRSLSVLADWLPFGSVLRLSGGFLLNGNKVEATATPSQSYTINGIRYSASQVGKLTGKISFKSPAPYLGIGFGNPVGKNKRLGVVFDLGVILQGSPEVDLTGSGPIAQDPTFQKDLNQEAQEVEDVVQH